MCTTPVIQKTKSFHTFHKNGKSRQNMAVGEPIGDHQTLKPNGNGGDTILVTNLSPLDVPISTATKTATNQEEPVGETTTAATTTMKKKKMNSYDKMAVAGIVGTHLMALYAPFCFSWDAFWLAVALYHVMGLFGICFSYHRNLAHNSFKVPKWLEYFCAYCGAQALQGDPMTWVSNHRFHHQYTDTERDPHSPIAGFWHSHMSWIFDSASIQEKCGKRDNVGDLKSQAFYRWLRRSYVYHVLGFAALLYAVGGFQYLVWGIGVRTVFLHHSTFLVNSAAHVWGSQSWKTGDLSRNNWWVAILTFGEGWHNNHHAFKYSARQGLEWWQVDVTWYVLSFLRAMGLAYDVKLPSQSQMHKLALKTE